MDSYGEVISEHPTIDLKQDKKLITSPTDPHQNQVERNNMQAQDNFLQLTKEEIDLQRKDTRSRYEDLATMLDNHTKILLQTLQTLQNLKEINEDSVRILADLVDHDINQHTRQGMDLAIQNLLSSVKQQSNLQQSIYLHLVSQKKSSTKCRKVQKLANEQPRSKKHNNQSEGWEEGEYEAAMLFCDQLKREEDDIYKDGLDDDISKDAQSNFNSSGCIPTVKNENDNYSAYNPKDDNLVVTNNIEDDFLSPKDDILAPNIEEDDILSAKDDIVKQESITEDVEVTVKLETEQDLEMSGDKNDNFDTTSTSFEYLEHFLEQDLEPDEAEVAKKKTKIKVKRKQMSGGARRKLRMMRGPGEASFKCEHCPFVSRTQGGAHNHAQTHFPREKTHICEICGQGFAAEHYRRWHMKKHTEVVKEMYSCEECGKQMKRRCDFEDHMRTHTGERRYRCDQCGKGFMRNYGLKRHMISHGVVEKEHECPYCKKKFFESNALTEHIRLHTGEKPYECSICAKTFSQRGTLRDHEKNHSSVRPYKCKQCGKAFYKKGILIKHEMIHSDQKFICPLCPKEFNRKDKLSEHLKRMHPDLNGEMKSTVLQEASHQPSLHNISSTFTTTKL